MARKKGLHQEIQPQDLSHIAPTTIDPLTRATFFLWKFQLSF